VQSKNDPVKDAVQNALRLMRDSGFAISGKVEVSVDVDLPFMGYSTQRAGGNVIVVAGRAVESGMIEGLLIHELCHIYRTEQNHPSHNRELLNRVGYHLLHEYRLSRDYQVKTIQQAVNHIQDLYADDISFQVFKKSQIFTDEQAYAFFLDWINKTPAKGKSIKTRWLNVGTMLNNCFAFSNLTRHKIRDIEGKVQKAVERFLSHTDEDIKEAYFYFKNFMTNLKENVSEQQFEKDLTEYQNKLVKLAHEHSRQIAHSNCSTKILWSTKLV
jgi:hypothetical protein